MADRKSHLPSVLTIAGSDCSGGAGIQADIKTLTAHRVYASSVLTALTVQNTLGVTQTMNIPTKFVDGQLVSVLSDICPQAVKIGMVVDEAIIKVIAARLREYQIKHIVVDPVMVSTSGRTLLNLDAMSVLIHELFPLAEVITPNIPEAEQLCRLTITDLTSLKFAAEQLATETNTSVLIKGGHFIGKPQDVLWHQQECYVFAGKRIDNPNTHGTGCTLSSAIAANLALGYSLVNSVERAKQYITGAIEARLNLGKGNGPLNHMYAL